MDYEWKYDDKNLCVEWGSGQFLPTSTHFLVYLLKPAVF